ncbi:hypothetical protein NUSPORA_02312 [Nucleospora cyclopteri]
MLNEIHELCGKIKLKTEEAKENILYLKKINFKLESLINSIEAYSVESPPSTPINSTFIKTVKNTPLETNSIKKIKQTNPLNKISTLFTGDNKKLNQIAQEIYLLIEQNKKILLDEIVKRVKLSKYKTIEILNVLVKEKIVTKKFDKGFVYEIRK